GREEVSVIDSVPLSGGTFSAQLIPQIADLLAKNKFQKSDLSAFVVVSGPGSFTGLRVGLAAIKALAEILQKPIVAVSMLELFVLAAGKSGRVGAVIDAGRGEVYLGTYEISENEARLIEERVVSKANLSEAARRLALVTADAKLAESGRESGFSAVQIESAKPEMIAALGWKKLRAGEKISPEMLDANYIRRSDEIFAKPVSGSKT
ncbi:MAG TPA: tRNA (adenosine(37)-N6)-threonylcarbamoyltransferase complex dimerization subunit type 1 TsaB, partial [Candidatus Sulfotelmatobacter sp.]|nr:tRNA (adenosine(37)-N6)-threonylcarbamoyltransferase complex dimerization subunit type 1 TsaB [Candidatus Sulfotelmatobacter sp.]